MKKQRFTGFWNMGTFIWLCSAIGIVLGALLQNVVLWLCLGACIGVLLGAITSINKTKE
ncbi:MAG: hypothetical protein GX257_10350 [Clostridiales bacterium]|nr:hypothetical protein [Clostridiales bacterium]